MIAILDRFRTPPSGPASPADLRLEARGAGATSRNRGTGEAPSATPARQAALSGVGVSSAGWPHNGSTGTESNASPNASWPLTSRTSSCRGAIENVRVDRFSLSSHRYARVTSSCCLRELSRRPEAAPPVYRCVARRKGLPSLRAREGLGSDGETPRRVFEEEGR